MERELTVLDAYTNRVYKIIMLIIPFSCLCASTTITVLHYLGYYPIIDRRWMWAFNVMDLVFLAIGIFFVKTGFDGRGIIKKDKLLYGKYFAAIVAIVQWNAISYIWPFRDLWAFSLLFTLGEAFFFDIKVVGFTSAGLVFSTFLSWVINGEYLLPVRDEFFVANMTFRIVCMFLTLMCVNILTFFGGKFLVEELEKYVYHDPLTHLLTRRKMNGYLQKAYAAASGNEKKPFSVFMIDIDDFKEVNDTYGHDCGDEVLKMVASTVITSVGPSDKVFRWGGEEILVLVQSDGETAVAVAERVRQAIARQSINYRGKDVISVTVTIGVSAYESGKNLKAITDQADENLYKGKRNGKNQVCA